MNTTSFTSKEGDTHIHLHRSGTSFIHMLTVLFIGLRMTHHIDWPWPLVLSPILVAWALRTLILEFMKWLHSAHARG